MRQEVKHNLATNGNRLSRPFFLRSRSSTKRAIPIVFMATAPDMPRDQPFAQALQLIPQSCARHASRFAAELQDYEFDLDQYAISPLHDNYGHCSVTWGTYNFSHQIRILQKQIRRIPNMRFAFGRVFCPSCSQTVCSAAHIPYSPLWPTPARNTSALYGECVVANLSAVAAREY